MQKQHELADERSKLQAKSEALKEGGFDPLPKLPSGNRNFVEVKLYDKSAKMTRTGTYEVAGNPVAQICFYMARHKCRYGILSNLNLTYFPKLEMGQDGSMVLHYSDSFSPLTQQGQEDGRVCALGNKRLSDVLREVVPGRRDISNCFAKSIAVDDAGAADDLSHEWALLHLENEVAIYEGPALGLQGTVVPTVVHVGEFDMGARKQVVLVIRNVGHSLCSREGKRIAEAQDFVAVKKRVHAALRSLNDAGIIHGDMGRRNVTIREEDGRVCLIDLGSASCAGGDASRDFELFDMDFNATFEAELALQENSLAKRLSPPNFLRSRSSGSGSGSGNQD
ncbi:EKC/KEOPS complex subunit BUD32 [Hondaea fermentalgiana]|uniref:EKC/KEOPS complex subunit BUD32 n=1 Tax=Hondaea fermentalgiana TaxID=2315210 RepID=A0A2R5GJS4_9STRA|nr:EKC/KEOPS complex subunit BUD32 [Hondaea fermentalgiana]|eukprot:GBG28531.1 EKC/KEOPS complex subunit BUD32 [Hondaea fermentalgiana]